MLLSLHWLHKNSTSPHSRCCCEMMALACMILGSTPHPPPPFFISAVLRTEKHWGREMGACLQGQIHVSTIWRYCYFSNCSLSNAPGRVGCPAVSLLVLRLRRAKSWIDYIFHFYFPLPWEEFGKEGVGGGGGGCYLFSQSQDVELKYRNCKSDWAGQMTPVLVVNL